METVIEPLSDATLAGWKGLAAALPWKGPWVARTFEIDCPCPNGSHCGDSHTCEEVEAPEEYPNGASGDPAPAGQGQCVVQIDVPGLETFSKPCAAFIAMAHAAVPALLAEVDRLKADLATARAIAAQWHEAAGNGEGYHYMSGIWYGGSESKAAHKLHGEAIATWK